MNENFNIDTLTVTEEIKLHFKKSSTYWGKIPAEKV